MRVKETMYVKCLADSQSEAVDFVSASWVSVGLSGFQRTASFLYYSRIHNDQVAPAPNTEALTDAPPP